MIINNNAKINTIKVDMPIEYKEKIEKIPELEEQLANKSEINHTHDYSSISNTPSIPTKVGDLTNDQNYASKAYVESRIANITTGGEIDLSYYATIDMLSAKVDKENGKELIDTEKIEKLDTIEDHANNYHHPATHAAEMIDESYERRFVSTDDLFTWNKKSNFSGNYSDLEGKPEIPTKTSQLENDSSFATTTQLATKAEKNHVHNYSEIEDTPNLFSGAYADLTGKPTIPKVISQLENDLNFVNITQLNTKADKVHTHSYNNLEDLPTLFSGVYKDLTGKPTIPTLISELENDSNFTTKAYVEQRITDVATSGEIDLSDYVTTAQLNTKADKVHTHSYNNLEDLPTLFSGNYNDLINRPTVPSKTSELTNDSSFTTSTQLATKADKIHTHNYNDLEDKPTLFSGAYKDRTGKPTIPTLTSELENDSNFTTKAYVEQRITDVATSGEIDLSDYVTTAQLNTKADKVHTHSYEDLTEKPTLFSGNYKDLINKPTIPTKTSDITNDSNFVTTSQLNTELNKKANTSHTHVYSDILDAPVSFSGNYKDLINKPTIPTKVSDLENDENFATTSQLNSGLNTKANSTHTHSYAELEDLPTLFSGNYNDLLNKPKIPTAVSDLTNDLNFVDTTALATKSDKTHTHSYSSLTDLPTLKTRVSDMDDATNYMTITQITTELNKKANISHTHTFDDLNGFFYDGDTTNIIIPTKLGQLNNDMNFATKSYVDEQISNIDISAGNIGDTSLFATKSDLNYKVDKIEGKGLSTNDFTDSYRLKLDGLTNFNDSEINQKYNNLISLVNIPYNSDTNSVQLTTDRYQYISNFAKNITINLPKVTTFTEIVLFFIPKDSFYLKMPTVTFNRNIISMKRGSYYRMTFTYVNAQMGWISDVPTFIL